MLIQFNTDNNIEGSAAMATHFNTMVEETLSRFDEEVTRVEIYVKDVNGSKEGTPDKHCFIEARLRGLDPVSTSAQTETVHQSVKDATDKMKTLLAKKFEKRNQH